MANKWIKELQKLNGAVKERINPFNNVLRTASPSLNYIFGKTHGLPKGFTLAAYGPPKGGKSVVAKMFGGNLHQQDPDAIIGVFDSEMRLSAQLTDDDYPKFGIDPERLQPFETNSPKDVFNQISKEIPALCQKGMPLKLIIIDSLSGIQGRRSLEDDDVEQQYFGDHAQTIGIGMKQILPVIRKYGITLICIAQARMEMDKFERMRHGNYKMQGSFGLQHMAEYFMCVEKLETKKGLVDIYGKELVNDSVKDLADHGDKFATKIRVKMRDSSLGPAGRTGEFTFDFNKGVVSQWEEIARLAVNRRLVNRPNNTTYEYQGNKWVGKETFWGALKNDTKIQQSLVTDLLEQEKQGYIVGGDTDLEFGDAED